jgi:hypothetical protein
MRRNYAAREMASEFDKVSLSFPARDRAMMRSQKETVEQKLDVVIYHRDRLSIGHISDEYNDA